MERLHLISQFDAYPRSSPFGDFSAASSEKKLYVNPANMGTRGLVENRGKRSSVFPGEVHGTIIWHHQLNVNDHTLRNRENRFQREFQSQIFQSFAPITPRLFPLPIFR